ncbi:enoyl-CoA hydratase/isomerase family protein [Azotosporobacter soli]|uniref:enoyl-CoA hydratase/isomerase family protein n=1 Tax=Azotosporobacter soli TaxID=3055040 RepID=UPI0031FED4D1
MMEKTVIVQQQDGILRLTLNRPDSLNALNQEMVAELRQALREAAVDPAVRVVVLCGSGRGFCAGGDLGYLESIAGTARAKDFIVSVGELAEAIRRLPKPVLAQVHGVAAGAGFNLALACDLIVASRTAKFAQSFAKVGLIPDCGGTYLLPRLIGMHRAKELMFTGDVVNAEKLQEWGLLNHLTEPEELEEESAFWAKRLTLAPPLAVAKLKQALHEAERSDFAQATAREAELQAQCLDTQDHAEGVAAFREKRQAKFTGC